MKNMMMLVAAFAALNVLATAEWRNGVREPLWPEGKIPDFQEHQIGAMTDEASTNAEWKAEHSMPYLEWFAAPAKANGACMILISGGSYQRCCDVGLIKFWRDRFTALGYQTVNLVYRTPRAKGLPCHQSAWEDGQRAVRLVRSQAKERGFDPEKIGVIGMSAGGHLVTMLATSALTPAYQKVDALDDLPCHVNVAIANAPAYNTATAADGVARPQDGTTLTDLKVNPCFRFDAKTCPISFHHGGMDPYTPNGSTQCYREMRKLKVPAELHLYADKGHGAFGFERALEFLNQLEFAGKLGTERAMDHRHMPNDTIRTEKEYLWPEGAMPDVSTNQTAPYLVWFVPEKLTTKAIQVIVPGGAYNFCNFNGEGTPVAHYLNGKGMTAVVVMYRCPRPMGKAKHLSAWMDAQRAIRMVRGSAPARGLDPDRIGLMGFSAGGHLTIMTSVNAQTLAYEPVDAVDKLPCNVQWACPIYPAYALTDGADCANTNGGNGDADSIVPEFSFDADTPPMCFVHGDGDAVAAMGSVKCWEKLRSMGIQCDLHTLATRGHCFQIKCAPGTGSWTWLDRIWEFLSEKGFNQ